jgi:hypothetical protein
VQQCGHKACVFGNSGIQHPARPSFRRIHLPLPPPTPPSPPPSPRYVRNTTARAFSVVASALGIPALLPFLKAVCLSKKSWQARHTGIKIIQQIAILMGCAVLPHLKSMVDIIKHGLQVRQGEARRVRRAAAPNHGCPAAAAAHLASFAAQACCRPSLQLPAPRASSAPLAVDGFEEMLCSHSHAACPPPLEPTTPPHPTPPHPTRRMRTRR